MTSTSVYKHAVEFHMFLQVKGRIDARNSLETYCYNMKSTIEDKLGDKVSDEQKETVGFQFYMDSYACM